MAAKVAIIIGDYSNGWSDAIMVQNYFSFKQEELNKDREYTMEKMSQHLLAFIEDIENNETINPTPKDEPCCDKFEDWVNSLSDKTLEYSICPMCGKHITPERKNKYLSPQS